MDEDNREFLIPQDRDELQVFNENQYSVAEIIGVEQIKEQYSTLRSDLESEGASFIYEKFDFMYSCLIHFPSLSWKVIHELWDVALNGLQCQVKYLDPLLENIGDLEDNVRAQVLRNTKMMFYVFSELMVRCEERKLQDRASAMPQKGRRKVVNTDDWDWNNQKSMALQVLYTLVKLPLNQLWKPANISEDFLDQTSRCCLKLLEDREIGFVTNKATRDSIFQILSVLCKEYIFGLALMPRIIQLLMLYDHLAAPLAQSVAQLEGKEGNVGMLRLALQELNSDMDFLNKSGHNCGQFILELGMANPLGITKHLGLVTKHLERDPYPMRQGVIELLGHLILHVYNDPKITAEQIEEKNMIFEYLTDHLYDTIAFCRGKTLQVWKTLCEEDAVSTHILIQVVEKVQPCIVDKSSNVRKDAIKFMKTVLEHNPFAARLEADELKKQVAMTKEHLTKMERKAGICEEDDPERYWQAHSEEVAKTIHEVLAEEARRKKNGEPSLAIPVQDKDNESQENEEDETVAMAKSLVDVAELIRLAKFRDAVIAGICLVKKYDTKNVLGVAKSQATQATQRSQESDDDDSDDDDEEMTVEERRLQRKVRILQQLMHMACLTQQKQMEQNAPEVTEEMKEALNKQRELLKFLQDSLKFSELVHASLERVLQVLESSQTTEVSEAIEFISIAQQFGLLSEQQGMTRLLSFVHSRDVTLKSAITSAYKRIYLQALDTEAVQNVTHAHVIEAMQKVCQLVQQSPEVYERSLKELVQSWVTSRDVNKECIDVLWEMVTGTKKDECLAAMNMLSMVLDGNPLNVQEHLPYIAKFGFGRRGEECFVLARNACKVLTLASPPIASDQETVPYKLSTHHEVFTCLSKVIVGGLSRTQDKDYCDMVNHAMVAIFKVCENPSVLVSSILKNLLVELTLVSDNPDNDKTLTPTRASIESRRSVTPSPKANGTQQSQQTMVTASQTQRPGSPVNQVLLARLMSVVGSVARQLLVFLMEEVLVELRRQRNLADKKSKTTEEDGDGNDSDNSMSSVRTNVRILSLTEEEALDKVQNTCNNEVLNEINILGKILPLIEDICQHPGVYTHHGLQVAAVHALGRCMMLSRTYCSSKLRLLSTLMVKSHEPRVRIATIHSMADLLRRFPNETDPYSPNLYECLKDQNVEVRREGLVVLCKLILGDMLRVKFQISILAACLTDPDPCCRDIASYFFATLATKGNILYNVVLDMISQLSGEDSGKSHQDFETIMKVILPYIDKERQVVALVEKLCSRFPEKTTEKESHDLAVCIKILPVSIKLMKALRDGFNFYADKLKYVTVKMTFDSILQAARKQLKGENKEFFEEFQDNLNKCSDKNAVMEAEAAMKELAQKDNAENVSAAPKPKRKKTRKQKGSSEEEEDDDADDDSTDTTQTSSTAGSRKSARLSRQMPPPRQPAGSDDSGSDFDEAPTPRGRSTKTPARREVSARSQKKKAADSSLTDSVPRRTPRTRRNIRL